MRTLGAFIDWLTRNILKLLIIGVILFVLMTLGLQFCEKQTAKPPDIGDAQFIVRTLSRTYYTNNYEWHGDNLILHGYWTMGDYEKWEYKSGDFTLTRRAFKPMISRR